MAKDFNPALYYRFLTPFYDLLFKCFLPEKKIYSTFIKHLHIEAGAKVIDLGCGTATLTIKLAGTFKNAAIIGIDADDQILAIAKSKEQLTNLQLATGNASKLNFESQSIDTIVSSFLFCNLTDEHKLKTLAEVKRVLKSGGRFYITEWGKPESVIASVGFYILQLAGGFINTKFVRSGQLIVFLETTGFNVKQLNKINTVLGTVYFYEAG